MNLNNQNHYTYIDNKTVPIVFIHGVGLDGNMWSPQINYFKNHSTLTYDLLGHGKTPYKKESIKMKDYVHQLLSLSEFLNLEGNKFSTSRNWAVWLHDFLERYPDKVDELRYVLTAIAPESKDADFTWKEFQLRINSELCGILGNFINRAVVLIHKIYY